MHGSSLASLPMPSAKPADTTPEQRHYMAQDDLRTLLSAHEISRDPDRYKAAMDHAHEMHKGLKAVLGTRAQGDGT